MADSAPVRDWLESLDFASQERFCLSDWLPIRSEVTDDELAAWGVTLGGPVPESLGLLRYAVLPNGWVREPDPDDGRVVRIRDERGTVRLEVSFSERLHSRHASALCPAGR